MLIQPIQPTRFAYVLVVELRKPPVGIIISTSPSNAHKFQLIIVSGHHALADAQQYLEAQCARVHSEVYSLSRRPFQRDVEGEIMDGWEFVNPDNVVEQAAFIEKVVLCDGCVGQAVEG
jgi:hypothetical protein